MAIDALFVNPPAITYNSAGSAVTIVPSYESVFTHAQKSDCLINSCDLMEPDFTTPLAFQTNVVFGPFPIYLISASEIKPEGYSLSFCFRCIITPTGLPSITPFTSLVITVVADPLDCSSSLQLNTDFVDSPAVVFNYQETSKTIIKSYKDIFIHS